jgi:cell division protein FtsI/penicillin-binding protein 2
MCLVFVIRLASFQFFGDNEEKYREYDVKNFTYTVTVPALRGDICDRDGKIITTTKQAYALAFDYWSMPVDKEESNRSILVALEALRETGTTGNRTEDYFPFEGIYPNLRWKDSARQEGSKLHSRLLRVLARRNLEEDMTDDELREYTNRMQLEKNFYDAQRNLAAANPKKVSAGEKFMSSLMNDVIVPAAKDVGKNWITDTLKNKLGLDNEDQLTTLEKQYKKLEWETKISDLKKSGTLKEKKSDNWDDKKKQQEYEKNEANEKLEGIRREIAEMEAQDKLDKMKEERRKREETGGK